MFPSDMSVLGSWVLSLAAGDLGNSGGKLRGRRNRRQKAPGLPVDTLLVCPVVPLYLTGAVFFTAGTMSTRRQIITMWSSQRLGQGLK